MIKLPPLPALPWLGYDPESGNMHGLSHDDLRARDIEVTRCVLEAVAQVLSATYLERQDGVYVELPSFDNGKDCASAILNLEISHD